MSKMTKAELAEALKYAGSEAPRKERWKVIEDLKAHIAAQAEQLEKATEERNVFRDELVGSEAELAAAEKRIAALDDALLGAWNLLNEQETESAITGEVITPAYIEEVLLASGAALDQKPKPEPPEYVAGPAPSAFPGW